jgi:hypothetical protein
MATVVMLARGMFVDPQEQSRTYQHSQYYGIYDCAPLGSVNVNRDRQPVAGRVTPARST